MALSPLTDTEHTEDVYEDPLDLRKRHLSGSDVGDNERLDPWDFGNPRDLPSVRFYRFTVWYWKSPCQQSKCGS